MLVKRFRSTNNASKSSKNSPKKTKFHNIKLKIFYVQMVTTCSCSKKHDKAILYKIMNNLHTSLIISPFFDRFLTDTILL